MIALFILILAVSDLLSQPIKTIVLATYSGDGKTVETAFIPTVVAKYNIKFEDITSVSNTDSVGFTVIETEYDASLAPAISSDTTCFILNRNPAANNRGQLNAFLARKKNGKHISDEIAKKANVDFRDIVTVLQKIGQVKKPKSR